MNWRRERNFYQQDQQQRETIAHSEIESIKRQRGFIARSLIWSTGPTMLSLPTLLQTGVEYSITVGPTDDILNSRDCLQNLAAQETDIRKLIDIHTSYEPFVTVSAFWINKDLTFHVLRLGIVPCIEYIRTDTSQGWDFGEQRYIYSGYSTAHRVALLSPRYSQTDMTHYEHTPPGLALRGCEVIWLNINRTTMEKTLVFPTPGGFTQGEYRKTSAALLYTLPQILPKTTIPRNLRPQSGTIPQGVLEACVDSLHSTEKQNGQSPSIITMLGA